MSNIIVETKGEPVAVATTTEPVAVAVAVPVVAAPVVVTPVMVTPVVGTPVVGIPVVLTAFTSRHIYKEADRILRWKDPIETGLIFGIINFSLYLLTCGGYSLITLTSYVLLSILFVGAVCIYGTQLKARLGGGNFQNPLTERFRNKNFKISKEHLAELIEIFVETVNHVEEDLRYVFLFTEPMKSLKFAVAVFVASLIGKWVSFVTLFVILLWFAFIFPKVYELYHKEIDHFHATAHKHAQNYIEIGLSKIPPVGPLATIVKKKKAE